MQVNWDTCLSDPFTVTNGSETKVNSQSVSIRQLHWWTLSSVLGSAWVGCTMGNVCWCVWPKIFADVWSSTSSECSLYLCCWTHHVVYNRKTTDGEVFPL